ncbi:3'-5' exonuclease-like [Diospyros lotus]|uniref:3'-5' exonuclease-like n=1 Tax=Diospyros lotus TaxID=55363 RepID=UPI0022566018|nr:3'-5' exonuclease-like [Diospyros lotus]
MMLANVVRCESSDDDQQLYNVFVDDDRIITTVTHSPGSVNSWISEIERIHRRRLHKLIVGLDIEWRPHSRYHQNPAATLQLCVGRRCLIFQLIHAPYIPQSLVDFLGNSSYTFVGVGIDGDVGKLSRDYGLEVERTFELRDLAADEYDMPGLQNAGLKTLSSVVLGISVEKPREITMSRWDYRQLSLEQVRYASSDAFLSFEIGRVLSD